MFYDKIIDYLDFIGDSILIEEAYDEVLVRKLRLARHWRDQKAAV